MEKKKVPVIALENLPEIMEEVTKELPPLLDRDKSSEEQRAFNTFFGTLIALTLDIFDYLPPEQQDEILTTCGTWFDIGMLLSKSPKLLLDILERVNPQLGDIEVPDWLADKYSRRSL